MKININAYLFSPTTHLYVSGINRHIFMFSGEIKLKLSPEFLKELIPDKQTQTGGSRIFKVHDEVGQIVSYSTLTNTMIVNGHMKSLDPQYIKSLIDTGWTVSKHGAKYHRIRIPRKVSLV